MQDVWLYPLAGPDSWQLGFQVPRWANMYRTHIGNRLSVFFSSPFLRTSLKLHLFNELPCCLRCGGATRCVRSLSRSVKRSGGTLLACFISDEDRCCFASLSQVSYRLTCEDTQTDLVSQAEDETLHCLCLRVEPHLTDRLRNATNAAVIGMWCVSWLRRVND